MRNMEVCREEVFRRSESRIRQRRHRRKRAVSLSLSLMLCLVMGVLAAPHDWFVHMGPAAQSAVGAHIENEIDHEAAPNPESAPGKGLLYAEDPMTSNMMIETKGASPTKDATRKNEDIEEELPQVCGLPETTETEVTKVEKRTTKATQKQVLAAGTILLIAVVIIAICHKRVGDKATELPPKDFSFALAWNCNGDSTYDSATGVLVKTTHLTTHPEDYVTEYHLTAQECQQIWQRIRELDVESYPDIYDPGAGMAKPPLVLKLTVRTAERAKTITAMAADYKSDDAKGQKFLDTCRMIEEILTATEAWQALPDYEFFYS